MSTFAISSDQACASLDQAEAIAVERIERGEIAAPVEIHAPDGTRASLISLDGTQVVVSRQPRWRHGACPACSSPVTRILNHDADGRPSWTVYRCSRRECDYTSHS
jgi:hypothetical protein